LKNQKTRALNAELDEPYLEVFTLRTLGQLSFRDIGELFDKSENWACVVYYRARAKLKEKMEG
jgi:RNA polymerase sigma-70 factor (ECF subfamily)